MAKRIITVDTDAETAVIGHLRGWCHNSTACAICSAENRALSAERTLDQIISG